MCASGIFYLLSGIYGAVGETHSQSPGSLALARLLIESSVARGRFAGALAYAVAGLSLYNVNGGHLFE